MNNTRTHRHGSPAALSPAGIARRDAMRDELMGVVRARGRRRKTALATAASLPAFALLAWAAFALPKAPSTPAPSPGIASAISDPAPNSASPTPAPTNAPSPQHAESAAPTRIAISNAGSRPMPAVRRVVLASDPSIIDRVAIERTNTETIDRVATASIDRITDDDLVGLLTESGYQATLVRRDGRLQIALDTHDRSPPPPPHLPGTT